MPSLLFKLFGDSKPFEESLARAQRAATTAGGQIGKKFEFKDLGRTLATALGINIENIAENFARLWTGVSKDSEKAFEDMIQYSDKATKAVLDGLRKRRNDEQQLAFLQAEQNKLARERTGLATKGIVTRVDKVAGPWFSPGTPKTMTSTTDTLGPENRAKEGQRIVDQINENANEIADLQKKIDDDKAQATKEQVVLEQKLRDTIRDGQVDELSDQKRLNAERERAAELFTEAALGGHDLKDATELLIKAAEAENRAKEIGRKIDQDKLKLAEKIADLTRQRTAAQADVNENQGRLADAKNDRGRLSLGELANVGRFAFGADKGVTDDADKAREIQELQRKAEEARGGGRIDEANSLFGQADKMREGLNSLKSDERDPFKAYKDALKDSEEKLQKIVENSAKLPTNL